MKVLLGVSGSVAATLTPKIVKALIEAGHEVQVVATKASLYFFDPDTLDVPSWLDEDEWPEPGYDKYAPIKHIELREWAEAIVIAPLTANTLAKLANGICDNLLTCVMRAWNLKNLVVLAPAMNTNMWNHPATISQLYQIEGWHKVINMVPPIAKKLACGDMGIGAMAKIEDVVKALSVGRQIFKRSIHRLVVK